MTAEAPDAVIRNFQVIGEAMKNSRTIFKEGIPDTTGKRFPGFRDVLTHVYFGIEIYDPLG